MAELYEEARSAFARGELRWLPPPRGNVFRVMLVDVDKYPADTYADRFFSDVPAVARAGNGGGSGRDDMPLLRPEAPHRGQCPAKPVRFEAVPRRGDLVPVVFMDSGEDDKSLLVLIAREGRGLPITMTGGDLVLEWPHNIVFEL